ncbi:MAG: MmcQ/YjbR family DNA-binding protein [Gemmataceae bacterium]|nr:MmcQ/YjbR family DNA-binding protein [Gemmataceae bacterium]
MKQQMESKPAQALRKIARQFPEAEEGIACQGTAIECTTFKARNKAFLFVGVVEARLKLQESLVEAIKLAAKEPSRYQVGAHGWVKLTFGQDDSPPLELLARWIDESYRLLAPKNLAAMLPQRGVPKAEAAHVVKKRTRKKATSR